MKLHTYLNFGGNCLEAFQFYEKHLGGKIKMKMTFGEQPGEQTVPPEQKDKILYIDMELGEATIMASDVPTHFEPMRSVYLSLGVSSDEEAERVYKLLSDGGEICMPMAETFFAHRFAMLRDKFGTSWMVIHGKMPPQA
ncbi:MAG: VOC family protein [Acidobacteriota bacterium]|nr:VOC family protein [Acidobacteriota bacterium]